MSAYPKKDEAEFRIRGQRGYTLKDAVRVLRAEYGIGGSSTIREPDAQDNAKNNGRGRRNGSDSMRV